MEVEHHRCRIEANAAATSSALMASLPPTTGAVSPGPPVIRPLTLDERQRGDGRASLAAGDSDIRRLRRWLLLDIGKQVPPEPDPLPFVAETGLERQADPGWGLLR